MLSFGKGQKPISHLTLILSTVVVASLLFIASRMLSIKNRQEAMSAMKADALSSGLRELPAGNAIPASAGMRDYADYFIEMQ
jgi:hypothetical protein